MCVEKQLVADVRSLIGDITRIVLEAGIFGITKLIMTRVPE